MFARNGQIKFIYQCKPSHLQNNPTWCSMRAPGKQRPSCIESAFLRREYHSAVDTNKCISLHPLTYSSNSSPLAAASTVAMGTLARRNSYARNLTCHLGNVNQTYHVASCSTLPPCSTKSYRLLTVARSSPNQAKATECIFAEAPPE